MAPAFRFRSPTATHSSPEHPYLRTYAQVGNDPRKVRFGRMECAASGTLNLTLTSEPGRRNVLLGWEADRLRRDREST